MSTVEVQPISKKAHTGKSDSSAVSGTDKLTNTLDNLPLQETSLDIWDKKYRLKTKDGANVDESVEDTYQRVARALSEVEKNENDKRHWHGKFLWALQQGAVPAGRIISNAGALEHKPATSTTLMIPWTTFCTRCTKPDLH